MVRTGTQDEPQGKLLELFKSVSFADTVRQIGQGRFGDASTEVVLLWEFLGLKLYPRCSKEYRNFIEKGTVVGGSARSLMTTFLHPSDEALCLTILEVKMEEFLLWIQLGNKRKRAHLGSLDSLEGETDDETTAPAVAQPRGRRRQRARINRRDLTQDGKPRDLTLRRSDYNAHMRRMKEVRSDVEKEDVSGPTYGWYEHLANKIMESREEEITRSTVDGPALSSSSCGGTQEGCHAEEEVLIDTEGLFAAFQNDRIVEI